MYTVLVVDDEPMMRKSLQMILQEMDINISNILVARNGEEALTVCEEFTPDIIVTDVRMPKMDGLDLCSVAFEKYRSTSLVIISGYDDFKYAKKALKYGVKDYLLKPVNREEFITCIENCIKQIKENEANITEGIYSELKRLLERNFGESNNIENVLDGIFEKFSGLSMHYCEVLSSRLIEDAVTIISAKTGERVDFKAIDFTGRSKSDLFSWLKTIIMDLNRKINDMQINNKYYAIKIAKDYIEKNYAQEFSLEDISEKIGFNPSYFSQLFKAKTGQTFVQYKNQVRLEKAKGLLENTKKSVTQIAMEVGYNDISHFIRIYKKITGDTPNEYREKRGIS